MRVDQDGTLASTQTPADTSNASPEKTKPVPGGPGSQWRMVKLRRTYEIAEEEAARADAYGAGMTSFRNYARGWCWYSLLLYPGTMLYVSFLDIPSFLSTYFPVA